MFSFTQGNLGKNVRRGRISSSPVRKEEEHHYQPKPLMNRTSCFCGIVFFKHGTDNEYKAGVVDLRSKGGDPATCVVYLRNETRNQIDSMTMNAAITKTLGEEETKSLLELEKDGRVLLLEFCKTIQLADQDVQSQLLQSLQKNHHPSDLEFVSDILTGRSVSWDVAELVRQRQSASAQPVELKNILLFFRH